MNSQSPEHHSLDNRTNSNSASPQGDTSQSTVQSGSQPLLEEEHDIPLTMTDDMDSLPLPVDDPDASSPSAEYLEAFKEILNASSTTEVNWDDVCNKLNDYISFG